jgi:hypothetical protein
MNLLTFRACFHLKKSRHKERHHSITSAFPLPMMSATPLPMLGIPMSMHSIPSSLDYVQSHSLMHHGISVHFHLAGSINAETDIPLVPPLKHHNFRVFWLNNKEMFFTQQAEIILHEICRRGMERDLTGDNFDEGSGIRN